MRRRFSRLTRRSVIGAIVGLAFAAAAGVGLAQITTSSGPTLAATTTTQSQTTGTQTNGDQGESGDDQGENEQGDSESESEHGEGDEASEAGGRAGANRGDSSGYGRRPGRGRRGPS